MKRYYGILLAVLLIATATSAQVWQEWVARFDGGPTSPGDFASDITVDNSGNAYVTGYSNQEILWRGNTIKYDASGNQLWAAYIRQAELSCVAVDDSGYVYVSGHNMWGGPVRRGLGFCAKYDNAGNRLWLSHFDANIYTSLALDNIGNVYVTGIGGENADYITAKFSAAGQQIWQASYNGPGNSNDYPNAIAVDHSGNVLVTGQSAQSATYPDLNYDYATIKYSPSGDQLWVARYNAWNLDDVAWDLTIDSVGNVYVTGGSTSGMGWDYATVKYDSSGNELWIARYDGLLNFSDIASSIALDGSGNVCMTGYSAGYGTQDDYATLKYSPLGNQLWVARYNGPGNSIDKASDLSVDGSGNVYVTGLSYSTSSYNSSDYATIKYDASGNQIWEMRYNGPGNAIDEATALVVDGNGSVYVTGNSGGDFATIKYSQTQPQLEVTLTPINPPVQIPPGGGSFSYNVTMDNLGAGASTFDVWIMVQLPDFSWYGPVLGPLNLTLGGSSSITRLRTQSVPAGAPEGSYVYEARVGSYPDAIWNRDRFLFTKSGSAGDAGFSIGDWSSTGEEIGEIEKTLSTYNSSLITSVQPNPFNPITSISYQLSAANHVNLKVYDTAGRLVATLVDGMREAGSHEVTFDGSNLASGVYLCKLTAGDFTATEKLVLMK